MSTALSASAMLDSARDRAGFEAGDAAAIGGRREDDFGPSTMIGRMGGGTDGGGPTRGGSPLSRRRNSSSQSLVAKGGGAVGVVVVPRCVEGGGADSIANGPAPLACF